MIQNFCYHQRKVIQKATAPIQGSLTEKETVELALKRQFLNFLIQQLPQLLISSSLFVGGLILLFLRIPGWSLIIGLPAVQIGLVFLIFSYDRFTNKKVGIGSLYSLECQECGKSFLSFQQDQEKICPFCAAKHDLKH